MNKETITTLVGKVIKVDRGGPESRQGLLLGSADDHLTLLTEKDGVVYYKTDHIKSITLNAKKGFEFKLEVPEDFSYRSAENFQSLLNDLRYQWININRGGPEKIEGVLDEVHEDYVTLILNEEVIRLSMFHIRNVSSGPKIKNDKSEEKDKNEKSDKNGKNEKSDKSDKSDKNDKKIKDKNDKNDKKDKSDKNDKNEKSDKNEKDDERTDQEEKNID